MVNTVQCQDRRSDKVNVVNMREESVPERAKAPPNKRATATSGTSGEPATDGRSRSLWFNAPMAAEDRRTPLTRERVVAEALTVIAQDGVQALTMRTLAARLGVVPGALYHHVRNKEQLHDLVLDAVLAEVDGHLDPSQPWTQQIKPLAHRLRAVLEDHPGSPGSSRPATRSGRTPSPWPRRSLHHFRPPGSATTRPAWAFFLLVDYTTGFAVSSPPTAVNEQRVRDAATRTQLHEFFRSLPADRFPALVALGEHVWLDNRDERFTAGLDMLVDGLERAPRAPAGGRSAGNQPQPPATPDHPRPHSRRWDAKPPCTPVIDHTVMDDQEEATR
jgi:AcrR family transcriptional regulator